MTLESGFSSVSDFLFEEESFASLESVHCHILGGDKEVTSRRDTMGSQYTPPPQQHTL